MSPMEQVREAIRAEIAKAHPIEGARTSLELIAESAVRPVREGSQTRMEVLDEAGQPRMAERNGQMVPFTLPDLVEELRRQHPTLFGPAEPTVPASPEPAPNPAPIAAPPRRPSVSDAAPQTARPASRDWLQLGAPEPTPNPASPEGTPEPTPPPDRTIARQAEVPAASPAAAGSALASLRSRILNHGSSLGALHGRTAEGTSPRLGGWRPTLARLGGAGSGLLASLGGLRDRLRRRPAASRNPLVGSLDSRRMRWIPGLGLAVAAIALIGLGTLIYALASGPSEAYRAPTTAQADATTTGSIAGPRVPGGPPGALTGVPEIIDTATLSLQGKVVRLFGVEWTRGAGEPEDLARYLRGRPVSCEVVKPGSEQHRCQVDGQDLSKVVLFNGGGRATSDAPPDLLAAEAHARSTRTGLWGRQQQSP